MTTTHWLRTLGPPPDVPSMVAVGIAALLLWQGHRLFAALFRAPRMFAVATAALIAFAISAIYVREYLRGGPRIIDATSYWLEARALAEGHATWAIDEPTASVRGRFLLPSGAPESPRLGVIFPPGYPVLLAVGFLLGIPMWIGPILGALLVVVTYALAKTITPREDVARLAACVSAVCATLRYHTADTMSHGLAALLFAGSLVMLHRAGDARTSRAANLGAALAGLAAGWLVATRPVSALALLPLIVFGLRPLRLPARIALVGAALLPAGLLVLQQRAVTGSFFTSSQSAYYALADGPPGCFRYGFGAGIGCLHEHGSFVSALLPNGLDWRAAVSIMLRRLRLHVIDVTNLEPLALLALGAPILALREARRPNSTLDAPRTLRMALAVPFIVLAYAPFYFDGSYAGGGARFFADVLPIEHVLLALSVVLLAERCSVHVRAIDVPRAAGILCALAIGSFGIHTVFEHLMLRDREGGRPFFEPEVLASANVDRGLVFVGTDHAFNLAYDPGSRDAKRGVVVAREYGDDRDRLIWERLGQPASYRYVFEGGSAAPAVVPWVPGPLPHPYRFEAEAEWPPLRQAGGSFTPVFAQGTCAWGARLLAIQSSNDRPFEGAISFPVPSKGTFRLGVHVASEGEVTARFVLRAVFGAAPIATWTFATTRKEFGCATLTEELVNLTDRGILEVTVRGGSHLFIDAIALEPIASIATLP